jgi:F420H(2)-dependent quinone reductase
VLRPPRPEAASEARLWELMATALSQYAGYQRKVRRRLPVAVVERV